MKATYKFVVLFAMLLAVTFMEAATRTSTATGGVWATGTTWVGGVAPATTDLAIIATTGTNLVSLGANATCAGITVNAGSKLTPNNRTLTVNGGVSNLGTITITTGGITQSTTTDFTNSGTITITTGRITQNGNANFINSGSITYSGAGRLYLRSNLTNTGTLALSTAAIYFTGTNALASTVDGFTAGGTILYQRTAGSTTFNGNVNGVALSISASGGTLNLGTALNHTFTGAITITAGTLNGGSSTLHANFIGTAWSRTGTFTAGTGTVDFGGGGNQSIAGTATTFNNLTLSTSGTKTLTTVPTVTGILSMEGTATVSAAPTLGGASTIQYKGTAAARTTGVEFPNNFAGTGGVIIDQGGTNTITLGATKTAFNGDIHVQSGIFDVSNFTINRVSAGGALTLASGTTLRIGGTNTLPSNYTTHSIDATSTVDYDGTNQTVAGLNSAQGYGNLLLSVSGTKTFASTVANVNGTFTTTGAAVALPASSIHFAGKFTLGSGTTFTPEIYTHTLDSDFENNGATFNTTGSTFVLNGTLPQSIGGTTSSTFTNLTLNNGNGATLAINETVNGTLNLTNGLLDTGAFSLKVGSAGSITNASASSYVNGKLVRDYSSIGSKVFPIGKGGNYRPLTLNYTALTGTSTVTAEQMEGLIPGTIPADIAVYNGRYWQISQTGGSNFAYSLTLDGTSWTPTSYAKILKGDGATNAHFSVTTPNYTNTSSFTSFGNFGLGQLTYVTWLGASTDWFSSSNWTSDTPPSSIDDIRIPAPSSFYPSISGTSPGNDVSMASAGILQIQSGASVTLENGPLFTFQSGSTVTTGVGSKIVLKSGARYLNLSASTPTLEVQRQLTGSKGWRMLASPVSTTFSDMLKSPLVTQGFPGSSFPTLQPNVLWWLESDGGTSLQSWRTPTNLSGNFNAGSGYYHYLFNAAGRLNVDGTPSGSNYTDALPTTMTATGVDNFNGTGSFNFALTYTAKSSQTPSPVDTIYYDLNALDQGWNLLGNPTASTLNWDASGWTKTNVDNTIYIWDPSALSGNGDYLTWNGTTGSLGNGRISPFQAFWAHATAATTLSFTNSVKTGTAGTFLRSAEAEETISLPISLSVGDLQTTSYISFSDKGVIGPDRWDGYRLESMSENWLELYTLSSPRFVSPLVINHLPILEKDLIDIPLYCDAQISGAASRSDFLLEWKLPDNWPSDWEISLQDHQTEQSISMTKHSSHSFSAATSSKISTPVGKLPIPKKLLVGTSAKSLLRNSSSLPPFSIVLSKGFEIEYMSPTPRLLGNFPNPFGKITNIRFSLPLKAKVSIEVYTIQGLKIGTLADGMYPAGITEVAWDVKSQAPGLYFIRFESGGSVEVNKAILTN